MDIERAYVVAGVTFFVSSLLIVNLWAFGYSSIDPDPVANYILTIPHSDYQYDLLMDMLLWPAAVKVAHSQPQSISTNVNSTEYLYLKDCWEDPNWFRMVNY